MSYNQWMSKKNKKNRKTADIKEKRRGINTKGGWFNILFCFAVFIFVSIIQFDLILEYIGTIRHATLASYAILGIIILYTLGFLSILASAVVFNIISKSIKKFPSDSILSKLDKTLDSMLWWLILILGVGGYFLNMVITQYYL